MAQLIHIYHKSEKSEQSGKAGGTKDTAAEDLRKALGERNRMRVEFTEPEITTMRNALGKWGLDAQCDQTVEECAELIVALHKHVKRSAKPGTLAGVVDEIADVEMMLAQMRLAFDISDDTLRDRIEAKFEKLARHMTSEE